MEEEIEEQDCEDGDVGSNGGSRCSCCSDYCKNVCKVTPYAGVVAVKVEEAKPSW